MEIERVQRWVMTALMMTTAVIFAAAQQVMDDTGLRGTPTVFIDGKELPAASVPDLVSQIEHAVDGAG